MPFFSCRPRGTRPLILMAWCMGYLVAEHTSKNKAVISCTSY